MLRYLVDFYCYDSHLVLTPGAYKGMRYVVARGEGGRWGQPLII
jgi:hypothetical protein